MNSKDNRFYLQALGITGLFILMLLVIWIGSGGPANEAAIRNSNSTKTSIAATAMFLLQPFPTNTPLFILATSVPQTNVPGPTPTSPAVLAPTSTPITPQTNTSIPSLAPSLTPLATQTAVAQVPTAATTGASHQPTKAPPLIPQTGMGIQDPVEFIRWYFTRVWKERDYQNLWDNYLTPSFKVHVGSGIFEDYVSWWDSVERVDINKVDVIQNNGTNAWIRVSLALHMKDGHVLPNQVFDYDLLYDANRKTWMFDYSP